MTYGKSIVLNDSEFGSSTLSKPLHIVQSEAEIQFVEKLRAGDQQAFNQLVTRYSGDIYGFLFRTMKDPEEAKDITQETFLRAFKAIAKFRGEASVKTWLFRIAINQSRNRYRWWKRRKRDKTVSLDSLVGAAERPLSEIVPSDSLNPEDDAIRKERALSLHEAIGKLPDHFREAIVLCDVQGFAYEEIASILEINLGTVKSRISRGRDQLRKTLKDI
jgi:RNA polymerase sigma-70 factor (ECF subfamily)